MSTAHFENFTEKFMVNDLLIAETAHWNWSVRHLHCTLGSGVISLNRPAQSMLELSTEEGADYVKLIKIIESTLKATFRMEKMNYIMLMMVDLQVHAHAIPRYSGEVEFQGQAYTDQWWPKPPALDVPQLEKSTLVAIKNHLKSYRE